MALYRQPKSKFWWYSLVIDGKRVRKSTGRTQKYLAQIVMNDEFAQARDKGIEALTHKVPVLKEFAPEFLKWVEATNSIEAETKRYYNHGWEMLEKTPLAAMKMDKITPIACDETEFPGGPFTANQALGTLRRILTIAKEKGKMFGQLPSVQMRKVWGRSIAMSNADAALIASKMKDGSDGKDVLTVLRATGMRPKECYSMRWEYVTWETAHYRNPNGKTKTAKRAVPLLGDSLAILKRRHVEQGMPREGWVFPSDSSSGHILNIAKAFRIARKAAGLPKSLVLYTARHGAMTDLANVLPLDSVMRIGGHSDPRTALGYQHTQVNDLQARLDEARTNGRIN